VKSERHTTSSRGGLSAALGLVLIVGTLSPGCAMFIPDRTIENVMNQVSMKIEFVDLKPELSPAVLFGGKAGAMNFDVEVTLTNKNNVDLVLHGTAFRAYLNDKVVVEGGQDMSDGPIALGAEKSATIRLAGRLVVDDLIGLSTELMTGREFTIRLEGEVTGEAMGLRLTHPALSQEFTLQAKPVLSGIPGLPGFSR
jgi:hypothetical protein